MIVENSMFQKGGLLYTVVYNTSSLTVAYAVISKPKSPFTSVVYTIDKVAKQFISYDHIAAS